MRLIDIWFLPLGSLLLGGLGVLALARGVFGGRFVVRRSRACRRCRYDMAGTDGHRCPECGHAARSEGEHYAGAWRWSAVWLGLFLLLGGLAVVQAPTLRSQGWKGVLPGAAQAGMWDGLDVRLHDRLVETLWAGGLSEGATEVLRERVTAVLSDPTSTPAQIKLGVVFIEAPGGVDLFDEAGRLELIRNGRAPAVSAAILRSVRLGVPEGDEMRAWRREQVIGRDYSRRTTGLAWLMAAPGDDADRALIRSQYKGVFARANWVLREEIPGQSVLLTGALLDLLNDEDEEIRANALESMRMGARRLKLLPGPMVDRLKELAQDSEQPGWDTALEALNDASFDAGSWVGEWMGEETDPEVLHALLTFLHRRRDATDGVVDAVAGIANNAAQPLGLRLAAAKTYGYLVIGGQSAGSAGGVMSVYEELFAALLRGDPWAEAVARDALGAYPSNSAILALARTVPALVEDAAGIDAWLGEHPALARTVARWTMLRGTGAEKLRAGLRRASLGTRSSQAETEEGLEYISRWFTRG